ncbi:MAG TPA: hypothetical protein VN661_09175 [Candidatus Acidoferrales bacterium]|nr:hypothetical protein [Candidatus Acidoferrales bacterium]
MSRQKAEIWVLVVLLAIAGLVLYRSVRPAGPVAAVAAAGTAKFQPLNVQEPQLHLDLLEQIRKSQYTGMHRDIFSAAPIPVAPSRTAAQRDVFVPQGPPKPVPPPPPPPLTIPAEFFGYVSTPGTGKRVAFFQSGDNVLDVPEGDTFLNRFRLLRVGDRSVYIEEISSGRHATMQIVPAPGESSD